MRKETLFEEIVLDILGYREDEEWVALALDMDLRGYGDTFERALDELVELIEMQISFALYKGHPEMVWRAAEPVWFARFSEVRHDRRLDFYDSSLGNKEESYRVRSMPIPPAHVIAALEPGFDLADA